MSRRPVIALLTDFGTRDHYVGTMKGVMLGVCPDAALVDISHDIPAHDVLAGAFELAASYRYFPKGTIFLAVVDPGVGSTRRGIAVECGDYLFVAPDNGVLSVVFEEMPPRRIVELGDPRYARPAISKTFEGRDRFAPAAAWLATGLELTALGRAAGQPVMLIVPRPEVTSDSIDGQVVRIDRFGNLVTNIDRHTFARFASGNSIVIRIAQQDIARVISTYAEAAPGELCALFGSTDHLELALNGASAAASTGATRGSAVHVGRRA
jgi:S-adenosyl-L-methionine hydrolase (adenosine-forming)